MNTENFAIRDKANHELGVVSHDPTHTCILFLDFDGVLHGFSGGHKGIFSQAERIERVLRACPHVVVVFSTSWRFNQSMQQMKDAFHSDLWDRFVGCTPEVQEKWPPYVKHEREKECMKFMENKGWTGRWVAIDDAKDLFRPDCPNLIVTEGNKGMTDQDEADLIVKLMYTN